MPYIPFIHFGPIFSFFVGVGVLVFRAGKTSSNMIAVFLQIKNGRDKMHLEVSRLCVP